MAGDFSQDIQGAVPAAKQLRSELEGAAAASATISKNMGSITKTGGMGTGGSSMMPNQARFSGGTGGSGGNGTVLGSAGNIISGLGGIFGGVGQVANGLATAMPSVQTVINYATGYYGASTMTGGASRKMMEKATFGAISARGGMTSQGADAAVASLLTSRGMGFNANPNSTYMQTVNQSAIMARYLNMPVENAAASIEGLTNASGSSSLLRNFGIFTADVATGKEKTMPQIFEEIAGRLQMRGTTKERTMESLRRGSLSVVSGQIAQTYGGDTARMFSQYMIDRAGPGGSKEAMQNWSTGSGLGGDNPMSSTYDIYASETAQYGKAEDSYIKGIKDAVPGLTALNDISGELARNFGAINSFAQALAGNNVVQGGAQVVGGVGNIFGSVFDMVKKALPTGGTSSSIGPSTASAGYSTPRSGGPGGTTAPVTSSGSSGTSSGVAAASTSSLSSTEVFKLIRPVNGPVTLGFNVKDANHKGGHSGIDFGVAEGTPVQASADGVVTAATTGSGARSYGRYVSIDHGNGYSTLYGHLSKWAVSSGSTVKAGQVIAYSGNTGFSTGPHLHLSLFKGNTAVNPAPYLGGGVSISGNLPESVTGDATQGGSGYIGEASVVTSNMSGVSGNLQSVAEVIGAVPTGSSATGTSGATSLTAGEFDLANKATSSQATGGGSLDGSSPGLAPSAIGMAGKGGRTYNPTVNIQVHVAQASESEARRLATMVKKYIKEDAHREKMGRI